MRPISMPIRSIRYRPGGTWLGRVGRSSLFAWTVSIGLHGAVFAALYLAVFREDAGSRRVIIPEARLTGGAAPILPPSRVALELSRQPAADPPDQAAPELDELPLAAVSLDEPATFLLPGDERPDPASSLTSQVMAPAPTGPVSTFFGQAGNAYKVVYVADVSASLWIYVHDIIREVRRSIGDLVPTQRFHIVLARPGRVEEFSPRRLVPAIGRYKKEATAFLGTIARKPEAGRAQPIEAMERAFAVEPELIYFLSDGDYRLVQEDLVRRLRELNPEQAVKITVIGFGPSPDSRVLLERIAREHGGHFRVVEPQW